MSGKKQPQYEELKQRLDDIVARLSDEKLTLNEMMALYNEGNKTAEKCRKILASYGDMIANNAQSNETSDSLAEAEHE